MPAYGDEVQFEWPKNLGALYPIDDERFLKFKKLAAWQEKGGSQYLLGLQVELDNG